jgi:hypothetical protein
VLRLQQQRDRRRLDLRDLGLASGRYILVLAMTDPAGIPAVIEAIRHLHDSGAKHVESAHVR